MSKRLTTKQFISNALKIHKNRYDYCKSDYINCYTKVVIICSKHGEFLQTPNDHVYNESGCPKCADELTHIRCNKGINRFIIDSIKIHGSKYDYSKCIYINAHKKVRIFCKKHNFYWWQAPLNHLKGKGCPKCKCKASIGETRISKFLTDNKIQYITEKTFVDCRNPKTNWKLKFDFYIPSRNLLIEFDGMQHFKTLTFGNHKFTKKDLAYLKYKDRIKSKYAKRNKIELLRIKYTRINHIEKILCKVFCS